MKEKSKVDADSTSTLNKQDLVVKANLHSLESEMKEYMKTYIDQKLKDLELLMNARFTEILNSLEQKNETMKQEKIAKQSRKEVAHSNDVTDFECHTNPVSPHSVSKNRENGGPTSTDSVVKETDKPVEMKDDNANQAASFLKKDEQHEKDVGIEKQSDIAVEEIQPLESIIQDVADLATQDTSARTDEVAVMEKSLINTIKGLSTCAGQPWHMVNEVFVRINCDDAFYWVLAVITLKNRYICVYDSMASSRKRKQTSDIEKLDVMIPTYLQYSKFFYHKVPTDWTALKSYEGKSEQDPFQVEYVSEIAQQDSGSLDCGVFVAVYAEYLSEGLGIPCSGIDAHYHRLIYSSLLCKYGSEKAENGCFSENDDPLRPRIKFAPKKRDSVLHIK
ncbi:hypothetical protein CQW23_01661 [Capsicum baccatum]|uniref:Ubiquitin-like protease family profile domain-containing protein n=1 Tax=Capsicum baccatum TaxID=33114 RepID=A0A2G2XP88_CAPBA|nr:hypothetical protein CQW23_01661 [Capsicum baccatum]